MWGGFLIAGGNFLFGETQTFFICGFILLLVPLYLIHHGVRNRFVSIGGIYLQQYLSELFQPGIPLTDCMHLMIAQTVAKYLFFGGAGFLGTFVVSYDV